VIENLPSIRWALMTSASGQSISCKCLSFFDARGGNPYRLNSSSSDFVDGDMGESTKMECSELKSMDSYCCATALARVTKAKWRRTPGLRWTSRHTAPGNVRLRLAVVRGYTFLKLATKAVGRPKSFLRLVIPASEVVISRVSRNNSMHKYYTLSVI